MNEILKFEVNDLASRELPWEMLQNKTVLVTGATGFIGSFLINTLLTRNEKYNNNIKILAVVRNKARAQAMYDEHIEKGCIDFITQDVCTPLSDEKKADYIVHCASNAAPKEYSSDPVGTMKTNFVGTLNLLDYAKRVNSKRFLYVSTVEVYGACENSGIIDENSYGVLDSCNVRSCYPLSKKVCENLTVSYASQYGIDACIGRLSYIFGPGMKDGDSKIVAAFPRLIAKGENIVMKSKGEQKRSYTYVTDAVYGLLYILLKGENLNAYNISSELCETSVVGIANTLVSLYPELSLKVLFDLPNESEKKAFSPIKDAVLDNSKLKSLGWSSKVDLKEGLKRVVSEQRLRLKSE